MEEVFVPIEGYQGKYEVSNLGNVRKVGKSIKIMKTQKRRTGYFSVGLRHNGTRKFFYVHRLVAIAFLKNDLDKPFVNHKDGGKSNNSVGNLEWVTALENVAHAIDNGLRENTFGEKHFNSKLERSEVIEMRKRKQQGETPMSLAIHFNISRSHVYNLCKNRSWKNIV